MGKGSPKPTDQTVVQTNLPEYVQPYFERLLNRTEAETKQQYQPYQGQRLQTGGTDVTQAQQMGRNIAGSRYSRTASSSSGHHGWSWQIHAGHGLSGGAVR